MTRDEITSLRASACRAVAALGSLLDSLQLVDDILANPGDAFSDALIASQHLDEAASTADTLAQHASDIAIAVDRHQVALSGRAADLDKKGGSS